MSLTFPGALAHPGPVKSEEVRTALLSALQCTHVDDSYHSIPQVCLVFFVLFLWGIVLFLFFQRWGNFLFPLASGFSMTPLHTSTSLPAPLYTSLSHPLHCTSIHLHSTPALPCREDPRAVAVPACVQQGAVGDPGPGEGGRPEDRGVGEQPTGPY